MNSFYFWDEMAAKCLKSEHFQEAIQSYKHALESTDDNADQASVWANIGNIYLTIQDISAAVDAFLAASRLDPNSYDLECILERITANGYLDETAMILAKDMYALENVKTGFEGIEIPVLQKFPSVDDSETVEQPSVNVSSALEDHSIPVDVTTPDDGVAVAATESLAEPVAAELQDVISESVAVEPVSSEETSQPQVESDETVAAVEIAPTEPVAQAELFPVVAQIEPVEPVSEAETNQPQAESNETEATAEIVSTEPVAEIEPVEPVSSEETSQPVADAAPSDVSVVSEVAETAPESEVLEPVAEIAIPETVTEETNSEIRADIETSATAADPEISLAAAEVTEAEPTAAPGSSKAYIEIPVDEIMENPLHLRASMQSEELVESVRRHGILQPLVVTPMVGGKYMVVAGNRRLEAARLAGLEHVPAIVRSAAERDFLELALIENIQRVSLEPLELAEAYHLLVESFGMLPETIAASIGKSCSVVIAALNLLKLTEEGKQALQEKSISEGHARALVAIDLPALQNNALVYVLENRLGVRQTEDLVRIILNAVAVSRSYDVSYHEETLTETPWQESAPAECADDTVSETLETETVAEADLPQTDPGIAVEMVVEPEVEHVVAETSITEPEPALVEAAIVSDAETTSDVVCAAEQPVELDVVGDAVIDLLVAESEKAEALVETDATVEQVEQIASEATVEAETSDFYCTKTEAENQIQQDSINSPLSADLLVEETLEKIATPVTVPAESIFATANCDAARDMAICAEVIVVDSALSPALETTFQKAEENLADVIEEIVQFTAQGDAPLNETLAETSAAQAPINPEPVALPDGSPNTGPKEPEGPEIRTQLKGLEAIAVYRRVVENNPGNVRIWHLLGNLYSDMGQYEEAIDCLKRTIELDPGKYTYYYHLGLTLAIARRYPEAILALEKTIELAPQHILAHCSLAGCYRRIGNEAEAQRHIETAKPKLMQEKAYNRACFESISGNSDQAIELLQIALDVDKTPVEWLVRDPDLDFIRDDPRFQAMVAELTLPV